MNHLPTPRSDTLRHRADSAAARFSRALARAERELRAYNSDQPRLPAGQPGGGQWTSEGEQPGENPVAGSFQVAGGFDADQRRLTVDSFVSKYCRGAVRAEIPGQFWDSTVSEIIGLAAGGDRAARSCVKILKQNRFRK